MKNPLPLLRKVALTEGVSFLLLLGVAMPLKYVWNMPMTVKIVGWIHGILFMVLVVLLILAIRVAKWPLRRATLIFIAALLPFGPFIIDRRMVEYERELK